MSEVYVLTSALNANDLLNQIVGQASARGWTLNYLGAVGPNSRRGHISKGGVTVNLGSVLAQTSDPSGGLDSLGELIPLANRDQELSYDWGYSFASYQFANPDVLGINVGTGFDAGSAWYAQPGADRKNDGGAAAVARFQTIRSIGAIGKVHMFFYDDPVAMVIIAEVRPGEFYWLAAGMLQKDYPFSGGQFYGASLLDTNPGGGLPSSFSSIRTRCVDSEALTQRGNGWGLNYQAAPDETYSAHYLDPPTYYLPGYWNENLGSTSGNNNRPSEVQLGYEPATGRLWASPPRTYVHRRGGGHSYLGVLPHTHYTTVSHFVGAEVVSVGGVEYMIFPFNWRDSPYTWDSAAGDIGGGSPGPWYRNNCRGSGVMLRKPVA